MSYENCGERFTRLPLTHKERIEIIQFHNDLRSRVAKKALTGFGPAKKIRVVSYSLELEFIAQCWVSTCFKDGIEDTCRRTVDQKHVGQNIYIATLDEFYANISVRDALVYWEKKYRFVGKDVIHKFWYYDEPGRDFIQMIWQDTTLIGCGRIKFMVLEPSEAFVCNYAIGVLRGFPIYEEGEPVCKYNTKETEFLCGKYVDYRNTIFIEPFELGMSERFTENSSLGINIHFVKFLFLANVILLFGNR